MTYQSGKVLSGQSIAVKYAGKILVSRQKYSWKVRAWDKDGIPSDFSRVASWEMALLSPGDWEAKWRNPFIYSVL